MKRISKQELLTYTKPTIFEITSSTYSEEERHYPDSLCLYVAPHCEWEAFGVYLTGAYFETEYSYETLYLTRAIEWVWVYEEQDLLNLKKLIDGVLKGISVLDVECRVLDNGNLHLRGYYLPKDKIEYYLSLETSKALEEILTNYTDYTICINATNFIYIQDKNTRFKVSTESLIKKLISYEGIEFIKEG